MQKQQSRHKLTIPCPSGVSKALVFQSESTNSSYAPSHNIVGFQYRLEKEALLKAGLLTTTEVGRDSWPVNY